MPLTTPTSTPLRQQQLPHLSHGPATETGPQSEISGASTAPPGSCYDYQNLRLVRHPGLITIPPPRCFHTADGVARPPSPYMNEEASMAMPPLTWFGPPFGEPMIGRANLQAELRARTASSPGHQRNTTTVSSSPQVASSTTTRNVTAKSREVNKQSEDNVSTPRRVLLPAIDSTFATNMHGAAEEDKVPRYKRLILPDFDLGPSETKVSSDLCEATPPPPNTPSSDFGDFTGISSFQRASQHQDDLEYYLYSHDMENLDPIVPDRTRSRSSSGSSTSTVASDSWNTMYLSTTPVGSPTKEDVETIPEKVYPLNEYTPGGREHGIEVRDFAFAATSSKTIRFASPLVNESPVNRKAASDSFGSSHKSLIDLDEGKDSPEEHITSQVEVKASSSKNDDTLLLPATTYRSSTATEDKPQESSEDDDPFISSSRERLSLLKQGIQARQTPKKYTLNNGPLELLNRATDTITNVAAARSGMGPVRNTGVLDRNFRFPARGEEQQRFSSAPTLRPCVTEGPEASKRSSSLMHLFGGFGGKKKGGKKYARIGDGEEAMDLQKPRESLARRIGTRLSDFIVRKGW